MGITFIKGLGRYSGEMEIFIAIGHVLLDQNTYTSDIVSLFMPCRAVPSVGSPNFCAFSMGWENINVTFDASSVPSGAVYVVSATCRIEAADKVVPDGRLPT